MKIQYTLSPHHNRTLITSSTGLGRVYQNYKKVQNISNLEETFDIGLGTPNNPNLYLISQTNNLTINQVRRLKNCQGRILVNTHWLKNTILNQVPVDGSKFVILPFLQDFQEIQDYYDNSNDFLKLSTKYKDYVKFYNISENKQIKGINELINAFIQQFQNDQKVLLVLRYPFYKFIPNMSRELVFVYNQSPKIIIINELLSNEKLYSLHKYCDCYVSPCWGSGWQIPVFHASYFKKGIITGNHTGQSDWIDATKVIVLHHIEKKIKLFQYQLEQLIPYYQDDEYSTKLRLWDVNYITCKEISSKLRLFYQNGQQYKELAKSINLQKYSITNINAFLQG